MNNLAKYKKEYTMDTLSDLNKVHKDQSFFWVDSTLSGVAAWGGKNYAKGLPTLALAYSASTASRGDHIYVSPYHTETVTSVLTVSKAGVQIIGKKLGNQRPVITGNSTADTISLEAAGCSVKGLEFAVPGTDAQTADINIAAARCSVEDTLHHGSTTALNKVNMITLTAAANYALIDGVRMYNTTVEVPAAIAIEGALTGAEIRNSFIFDTIGYTNGAIADAATALSLYIHHNVIKNAKAGTVVLAFSNNSTGVCSFNHISGRHTTLASNVTAGTGMDFFENRVTEEAALNGAIIPAADTD